jgi:ATP/maltotriose-dependent transcriptional regulator MalT
LAADVSRAVETVVAGAGDALRDYLRGRNGREPDVTILGRLLSGALKCWPEDTILVLDDYHQVLESGASDAFIGLLAQDAPIRLVLSSRARPAWALARQLIYGHVFELGRADLAMTDAEVDEILPVALPEEALRLRQLADGWPAVIGLASHISTFRLPPPTLSKTLHNFFAQELFDRCSPGLQSGLIRLALLPLVTESLAEVALACDAPAMMAEAVQAGFLTTRDGRNYDLHPLLRAFLREKAPLLPDRDRQFVVDRTLKALSIAHQWDDAFTIIVECDVPDALPSLIEAALDHLLRAGRVATIRRWLEQAREARLSGSVIDLAEAELAVRAGDLARARFYADRAADYTSTDDSFRFRSLNLLGLAAQLSDDYMTALSYYRSSEEVAQTPTEIREALWGQFAAAHHLEHDDAISIFSKLEALTKDLEPDDYLRIANGRFRVICLSYTSLQEMADELATCYSLTSLSRNPHVICSFLLVYAQCLMLTANYTHALRIGIEAAESSLRYGLAFAVPYAETVQAFTLFGLKRFDEANPLIDNLIDSAERNGDTLTLANARVARARLLLAQGAYVEAMRETDLRGLHAATPGMHGESLAVHALALACSGELSAAEGALHRARTFSQAVETETTALATEAIIALQMGLNDDPVARLLQHVDATHHMDALVAAYRAYPKLLSTSPALESFRAVVEEALASASDRDFAKGLAAWPDTRTPPDSPRLSKRESEVLALVAIGLSNAAIAKRLYISEATVKVHMRHIFEKLDVQSRTQAALHPAARRVHYATS